MKDFDVLLGVVLDAVGDDRIDRNQRTGFKRALVGDFIPGRDEERRVFTKEEKRRMAIAALIGVSIPMGLLLLMTIIRSR